MLKRIFTPRAITYFLFSSAQLTNYHKYLSDHVIKIIKSKPHIFGQCEDKLNTIMNSNKIN